MKSACWESILGRACRAAALPVPFSDPVQLGQACCEGWWLLGGTNSTCKLPRMEVRDRERCKMHNAAAAKRAASARTLHAVVCRLCGRTGLAARLESMWGSDRGDPAPFVSKMCL